MRASQPDVEGSGSMEILTLLPSSNALDCDQHFSALDFMATFNVTLQRNQSIQLFAISIAQWCPA